MQEIPEVRGFTDRGYARCNGGREGAGLGECTDGIEHASQGLEE